jgi:eukaryotic-like serine/threonine-protein kinase
VTQTPVGSDSPRVREAKELELSGQPERAIAAFVRAGRPDQAARVAAQLGRLDEAARLHADAAMHYEAAAAFQLLGDHAACLDNLIRVPRDHPRYRAAALQAIGLADEMDHLELRLETFLDTFVSSGPRDDGELEAFYTLGQLYLRQGFPENAEEAFRKIEAANPGYRDVSDLLKRQRGEASRRTRESLAALEEDVDLLSPLASQRPRTLVLPQLPDLPDAPPPSAPAPPVVAPPASVAAGLGVGAVLAERYRIEAEIGVGGMAVVYRASDLELQETVALKVFKQPEADPAALDRFRQELKLSRQLVHPNIARLYDIGVHAGLRYISMELLEGITLETRLLRPIDVSEGLSYLVQACAGLQAAHDRGVIHRDVKPANLFILDDGTVKVMDFGIAKRSAAPGMTVAGMVVGTPEYMAPEQVQGSGEVTPAADLYALGVVAYEMFTGRRPFEHPDLVPLLLMQIQSLPDPPRSINPSLDPVLEGMILKLLEKQPGRRFGSCRELGAELDALRQGFPPV